MSLPVIYGEAEHSVWHGILNGDVRNDFVAENALALSALGVYHWQKDTGYIYMNFLVQNKSALIGAILI